MEQYTCTGQSTSSAVEYIVYSSLPLIKKTLIPGKSVVTREVFFDKCEQQLHSQY